MLSTIMEFLSSSLQTGLSIAGVILAFTTLVVGIWYCGCYLGHPLAVLLTGYTPTSKPEDQDRTISTSASERQQAEQAEAERKKKVRDIVAGMLAVSLCYMAFILDMTRDAHRPSDERLFQGTLWSSVAVALKSCLEGMVALGVLSGVVKLLKRHE